MKHVSIPLNDPIEIVEFEEINDQISKVKIKVCYVGNEPNRNKSIITKDSARKLARTLRGSPIVGYYNEAIDDFEAHEREMVYEDGKFKMVDVTKAYGFVDTHATVWF